MSRPVRRALATVLVVPVVLASAACSGSDEGSAASPDELTPTEVLGVAQETLDETEGVRLSLTTDDLPEGVTGLTSAVGVATQAPAFDGAIKVVLSGTEFEVPVVAVDGKVFAQIPLTPGYSDVDPAEYGAPDPAALITPDRGFSSLLPVTADPTKGESVRGGADNTEILTTYTGTIPGEAMKKVIPSSSGDTFDAAYLVSDDGELREAELTGVFYPDSEEMTYTVTFDDYGTDQAITAP